MPQVARKPGRPELQQSVAMAGQFPPRLGLRQDSESQAKVDRESKRVRRRPARGTIKLKWKVGFHEVSFEDSLRLLEIPALVHQRDEAKLRRIHIESRAHSYAEAMRQAPHNP